MRQDNPVPLLLSGRIVYSDGSARQRYVLVRDGRIVWVGVGRPPAVLAAGDYFVFWDHRAETRPEDDRHLGQLAALGPLIMNAQAADQNANGQPFETWAGFPLKGGECIRMRFERRAFFPW